MDDVDESGIGEAVRDDGPSSNRRDAVPFVVAVLIAGVIVLVAALDRADSADRVKIGAIAPVTAKVVVDSRVGQTFTPALKGKPPSSAEATYTKFTGQDTMPSNITAQFGFLTWPASLPDANGHQTFVVKDKQVWAYIFHECMAPSGVPGSATPVPTQDPDTCVTWRFLDPVTGHHIEDVQQN
jgi:hypothetical protein